MSVTSKRESQQCSAGKHFWQKEEFAKQENKKSRTSVTADLCHYTQVRKIDPVLRNVTFLKLVEKRKGEKNQPNKRKSPKRIILSSSIWIINPRTLKR